MSDLAKGEKERKPTKSSVHVSTLRSATHHPSLPSHPPSTLYLSSIRPQAFTLIHPPAPSHHTLHLTFSKHFLSQFPTRPNTPSTMSALSKYCQQLRDNDIDITTIKYVLPSTLLRNHLAPTTIPSPSFISMRGQKEFRLHRHNCFQLPELKTITSIREASSQHRTQPFH
jgi:hypothetical protein